MGLQPIVAAGQNNGGERIMTNMSKEKKRIIQAIPFMLPSIIGMVVFSFLPIIMATALSMTDWSGLEKFTIHTIPEHFIGLENYAHLLTHQEFWNTLLHVIYSMIIALILNTEKKFTGVMRVLFYIPVLTSWVAASLIWKWVLSSRYGVINSIIGIFGMKGPDWLTNKYWAMPGIVLASVWKDMGYYGLYIFGGLRGIDPTYYEAAKVDGAGKFRTLISVTLPLLSPTLFYCLIMSLINDF